MTGAEAQQKAAALLQEMLPDGEMCKAEVYDELHFIDQGNNCEAVLCPSCGRRFAIDFFTENDPGMTWWFEVTDAISNKRIHQRSANAHAVLRCERPVYFTRV